MEEGKGKRRFPRAKVKLLVVCTQKGTFLRHGGRVKNISQNGVCLQLKKHVAPGTILSLEISSDELKVPLKTDAKLVRIGPGDNPEFHFEAGLEFLQMPPDERERFDHFVLKQFTELKSEGKWLD